MCKVREKPGLAQGGARLAQGLAQGRGQDHAGAPCFEPAVKWVRALRQTRVFCPEFCQSSTSGDGAAFRSVGGHENAPTNMFVAEFWQSLIILFLLKIVIFRPLGGSSAAPLGPLRSPKNIAF